MMGSYNEIGAIGYDQVGYNGEKTIILVLDILKWR